MSKTMQATLCAIVLAGISLGCGSDENQPIIRFSPPPDSGPTAKEVMLQLGEAHITSMAHLEDLHRRAGHTKPSFTVLLDKGKNPKAVYSFFKDGMVYHPLTDFGLGMELAEVKNKGIGQIVVTGVRTESYAMGAGFQKNDIILQMGEKEHISMVQFMKWLRRGDRELPVPFLVLRRGHKIRVPITLADVPDLPPQIVDPPQFYPIPSPTKTV